MNGPDVAEFPLGVRVRVVRAGDPSLPVAFDGQTGVVIGHSDIRYEGVMAPAVGIRFDDRKLKTGWITRWHVREIPETFGEKARRVVRRKLREWLEEK